LDKVLGSLRTLDTDTAFDLIISESAYLLTQKYITLFSQLIKEHSSLYPVLKRIDRVYFISDILSSTLSHCIERGIILYNKQTNLTDPVTIQPKRILSINFGGGHMSIGLVQLQSNSIQITKYDSINIGSTDVLLEFINTIRDSVRYPGDKFPIQSFHYESFSSQYWLRFINACERCIPELSECEVIEFPEYSGWKRENEEQEEEQWPTICVTQREYNEIKDKVLANVYSRIETFIHNSVFDVVTLSGNAIPMIEPFVRTKIGNTVCYPDLDPVDSAVKGTAIYLDLLFRGIQIQDIAVKQ
jgi:hypothetical protein